MSVLKFKQLIVAVTVTLIVVTLTHILMEYMSNQQLEVDGFDKLVHAMAYGTITFFFLQTIKTSVSLLSVFFCSVWLHLSVQ